jgi:hypothetical protein
MFDVLSDIPKRIILNYLKPDDIRNLIIVDKSFETITEDHIFWENYFINNNRELPEKLPKVSTYYLDQYERKSEAEAWLNYMSYTQHKNSNPCDIDLYYIDSDLFATIPIIEDEIKSIQHYNESSMSLFVKDYGWNVRYIVYFVSYDGRREQYVSEKEMIAIIAILLVNKIEFSDNSYEFYKIRNQKEKNVAI